MTREEILTTMTKLIVDELVVTFKRILDENTRTCANCVHIKSDCYCIRWRQRPPVNIIVTGCDSHFDGKDIPF